MIVNKSEAKVSVKNIELQSYRKDLTPDLEKYWLEQYGIRLNEIGKDPVLWYNGIYIPPNLIENFLLLGNTFVPILQVYFKDETLQMQNFATAQDNTIISLFIDSRSKDNNMNSALRPILMDFKITSFNYLEEDGLFFIEGIPNIDDLYIQDINSYPDMTSYECLKKVAEDTKMGFSSNIDSTNDKMTWLNLNTEIHSFIKDTTKRAYKSDNSFFTSFVDFFYNLNLVDVEQVFQEDVKKTGLMTYSANGFEESNNQQVSDLYIVSEKYYNSQYNNLYETYELINKSTKVSLNNGYKNVLYYYDRTGNWAEKAGTFLRFDIETNTDGKGIILKSTPADDKDNGFYKKNIKSVYLQPLDIDNTHKNFNYALILNEYNLEEIDKLSIKVTMRNPNFNLYRYQKLLVYVMLSLIGNESVMNERLSGGWVITGINYTYEPEDGLKQELIMVKRELSVNDFTF